MRSAILDQRRKVISKFISAYEHGITCGLLRIRSGTATGHYVIVEHGEDGRYKLKKALDLSKIQDYVLYSLSQEQLSHYVLSVQCAKSETRTIAEKLMS